MATNSFTPRNAIAQLIKSRRTVRLFTDDPVTIGQLTALLDIAIWAPNHNLREPWRFIAFTGEGRSVFANAVFNTYSADERKKYGEARRIEYIETPLHLVIVLREDPRQKQWDEDFAAVCCLLQNLQLAAWEEGIGMVWKSNPYMYNPKFRESVGVRPGEKIVAVLHIGYPRIVPKASPRTPAVEKLTVVDC
ncbi:nitroreductase [Paenibacillus sp. HB172176]|uniref:nitroreductase family protein n=1 Tax=Paenibacillus sp. HB172176 TaxID=2493690 RepID=UPI00143A0D97|nr:nitroreductase [Paenibacillus sp. HB172176]